METINGYFYKEQQMKTILLISVTLVGLTMCHYAPAQTTQIITPDGKMVTCIQNGQVITCF
jgi:hypothetical protein